MSYLLIGIGSALGGMARYWCALAIGATVGGRFPWGTLVVNVVGSMLIGLFMGMIEPASRWPVTGVSREAWTQFLAIGVLGGYTTFSSFSWQTLELMRAQQWWQAGANVFLSVMLCLLAVALGFWIATAGK